MENNVRNAFLKNHAANETGTFFLLFKKALLHKKASGQHLSFNIFWQTPTRRSNKNKFATFNVGC